MTDGAIAFTRIFGASSAANDLVKPFIALLAIPIDACIANPFCAATLENRTNVIVNPIAPVAP